MDVITYMCKKRINIVFMILAIFGILSIGVFVVYTNAENIDMSNQYSIYSQYGISYNPKSNSLFYNDIPIRYFEDNSIIYNGNGNITGSIICYTNNNNNGEIDVYTIGNSDNQLTGMRIADSDEFDKKTILSQSIDKDISIYKEFGLSTDIVGKMYFEDVLVRELYDPVTRTLITESRGAAFPKNSIDVIAIYDNGKLSGLKKTTQQEYNLRTQERIEAVQDYWVEQQNKKRQ